MKGRVKNFFSKNKSSIWTYLCLFLIFLVLERANVAKIIYPFGFSLAFALCYLGKNGFVLAAQYFICHIIYNPNFEGLIVGGSIASALILLYLIFKAVKKKNSFTLTLIFALISQAGQIYFNITSSQNLIVTFVMILISLCFVYICSQTFGAIFYRGLQSRFTLDESICFGLFLIALFSGFNDLYIFDVNITKGIFMLIILLCSKTLVRTATIFFSALMGLGISFSSLGITFLAIYTTYGILAASLSQSKKICAPIMIIVVDIVFGYFLNAYAIYNIWNILTLVVASIIYLVIPNKLTQKIKSYSYSYEGNLIDEYLVGFQMQQYKQRLNKMGEIFKSMQRTYLNLGIGEIERSQAIDILTHQIINNHCVHCVNFNKCLENINIKKSIDSLFELGMEKEKISVLDANNLLTGSCLQLSGLIQESNHNLKEYFEYEKSLKSEDQSKLLVSEHLCGTSDIFKELAGKVDDKQVIDQKKSRELLDELTYNKIIANECVVLKSETGISKIILVVRNRDVLSANILPCLKSVLKVSFTNTYKTMSRLAGWSIMVFVPANKYNISVGFAGTGKCPEKKSGDNHGMIKVDDNKYLFSIADGMGHGENASKISSMSLSLIENFYRAGFSTHIIMESVNRIMLSAKDENFSTLDAVLLDLSNGTADFIKIGASISVIKGKETSQMVVGESLPLGIVKELFPSITKRVLKVQDIIVIASDGVVDSFDYVEDFVNFINNERIFNVQMLADSLLEEALSRNSKHKDDMTILTIKLNSNF